MWHKGIGSSWEHWDTGSTLGPVQWVKDLALPQLWLRSQLQLRSDPWPGNSICHGAARKEKQNSFIGVLFTYYYINNH